MNVHINKAKQRNHSRDDNGVAHADIFSALWQKIYDKISDKISITMR